MRCVLEGLRCVLGAVKVLEVAFNMLEVVNGVRRVQWGAEVLFYMLFCMLFNILQTVESELRLLEMLE
jgi:hypothetical protein